MGKRYAESAYQEISIADGCNHVSTIVHEMMHATGNECSLVFLKGLCQAWDHYPFLRNCPLIITSHLWQMLASGRGRWAVSQKRLMIPIIPRVCVGYEMVDSQRGP